MFHGDQQEAGPAAGTDLEYQVNVDFWTAIRGGSLKLQITRQVPCPTCHGAASTGGEVVCPECEGTGQVTQMGGRMKFNIQCPRCGGTGKSQQTCATCNGQGTLREQRRPNFASSRERAMGSAFVWRAKEMPESTAERQGICT